MEEGKEDKKEDNFIKENIIGEKMRIRKYDKIRGQKI